MTNKSNPQIVVYALEDANSALEAAIRLNISVTLVSPINAVAYAGPAWFREIISQAHNSFPEASFNSILDCSGEAGHALAAIREGGKAICYSGSDILNNKITEIASQAGCKIIKIEYEKALDLSKHNDKASICDQWLNKKLQENFI